MHSCLHFLGTNCYWKCNTLLSIFTLYIKTNLGLAQVSLKMPAGINSVCFRAAFLNRRDLEVFLPELESLLTEAWNIIENFKLAKFILNKISTAEHCNKKYTQMDEKSSQNCIFFVLLRKILRNKLKFSWTGTVLSSNGIWRPKCWEPLLLKQSGRELRQY